jgi:hypothetical protein
MIYKPNEPIRPQHAAEVVEVADGKQKREICNIIGNEVVDSEAS